MMDTAQPTYTWHTDVNINGQPYPTRHPVPDDVSDTEDCLGDLKELDRQYLIAIHEAGHAIAGLAGHAHIHHAKIRPLSQLRAQASAAGTSSGHVNSCNLTDGQAFAVYLGAGERAEDKWLTQHGLWTPRRAVGIELGARSDREFLLAVNPHVRFGIDHQDYRVVHDLADQFVTEHWDDVIAVADALATRMYLTGDQIADLSQMPNGTHSNTCTYTA